MIQAVAFDPDGRSVSAVRLWPKEGADASIMVSIMIGLGWSSGHMAGWSHEVWEASGYSAAASIPFPSSIFDARFDRIGENLVVVEEPGGTAKGRVRYWATGNWEEQKEKQLDLNSSRLIRETFSGRYLATVDKVNERIIVNVWDIINRRKSSVSPEASCLLTSEVLLSADGNTLALLCVAESRRPDSVTIYRRQAGEFVEARLIKLRHGEELVLLSPDGNFLAVIKGEDADEKENTEGRQPRLRLISVASGEEVNSKFFSGDDVVRVDFSPDSKLLVVQYYKDDQEAGKVTYLEVLRVSDRKKLAATRRSDFVFDVVDFEFSPDSRYMAVSGITRRLTVFDLRSNNPTARYFDFTGTVVGAVFDPRSRLVAAFVEDTIQVIDLEANREIAEIPNKGGFIYATAFSYDGKYLVTKESADSGDRSLLIWHLPPEPLLKEASTRLGLD